MSEPRPITLDELAKMTQRGLTEVRDDLAEDLMTLREETARGIGAVRQDILESEQRLLMAVKGIEVRKEDFVVLRDEVHELTRRVSALEKRP